MKRLLLYCLLVTCQIGMAQRAVPPLWGHRVHDEASVLSAQTIDHLEHLLKQHEDSTSNQIAVLVIPSLDGDAIEDYSIRVATEWKLGKAKNDNGVLLLVAINDHKMRIEVGQGLEGVLTDAASNQIIRNVMAPYFREQRYDEGIRAGTEAIIDAVKGEFTAEEAGLEVPMTWQERILIGAFIFGILGVFTILGLFVQGCAGWFMYAFLIPFYAVFPMAVLGATGGLSALAVYAVAFPIAKLIIGRSAWGKRIATSMNNTKGRSGGGWSSGGGWFGGSSGGGWSGGGGSGFSGGGGSFGGGGSSGSW